MQREISSAATPVASVPVFAVLKWGLMRQFDRFSAGPLYRTAAPGDLLWETYLASFPEGSNPIFRKRTHHDCSCCRHFIRAVGAVVSIADGDVVSLWDVDGLAEPAYQYVAAALSAVVKSYPIENRFFHDQLTIGTDQNHQDDPDGVLTWNHLFVRMPRRNNSAIVLPRDTMGPALADARASYDVMLRGLTELTPGAVETVLDLIARNAIYRGEEHGAAVKKFQQLQTAFLAKPETGPDRSAFVWRNSAAVAGSVSRIRNTSIGQLLIDLSGGVDVERAVASFERIVAPENYKRTTALVTTEMVNRAKEAIEALGLTSALDRRFATLADVSVNNVIYADRSVRPAMRGGVFDQIAAAVPAKVASFDGVQEIPIDVFLEDVLPQATKLEVMVENRHANNFVSLIAPADSLSASMFMWENRFSWSYAGDFTDAIKERVKKAGGNVTGDVCCRLAWSNYDDLDFHMIEPDRYQIYYITRRSRSPSGGMLDVDANAGGGGPANGTREPVENIFYSRRSDMKHGTYSLSVHQFAKIESKDVGFEVQIDIGGDVTSFVHSEGLWTGQRVDVAKLVVDKAGIKVVPVLPVSSSATVSQKIWGVDTNAFTPVNVISLSPNHWDGAVGNRHYFFFLDGCRNDGSARGFYNEFLSPKLAEHRRVLDLVGAKMRAEEAPEQLSGIGISSTQRNSLLVRVSGSRTVRVMF